MILTGWHVAFAYCLYAFYHWYFREA